MKLASDSDSDIDIDVDARCTGCGMCIATCPERALSPGVKRPLAHVDVCTACLACVEVCPVDAIAVTSRPRRAAT